jgi:aspartyl/glutamyl-tRNA(Asn/Gln) amidotransferase C subunit
MELLQSPSVGVSAGARVNRKEAVDMEAEIDNLCKLSCLNLSGKEERARAIKDLQSIVDWMDQIHTVDVGDATPYDHYSAETEHDSKNLRSLEMHEFNEHDELEFNSNSGDRDWLFENVPRKDMNFIISPKVSPDSEPN